MIVKFFYVISKAGYDIGLTLDLTPKIDDNLRELFTILRDCPDHLIESAKMFFFFEHLIKTHSLETLIASTMNNIAPRADKNIMDSSSVNLWYTRLDEFFDFELGPVFDAISTSKQRGALRHMNPPFLAPNISPTNKEVPGNFC